MNDIAHAVRILRAGGLVGFPTETVYGIGGDATNPVAVRKIFAAKGRPATNPIIAHVVDANTARRFALNWPVHAEALTRRFWPGPLTIILPSVPSIATEVRAGRETVALRSPDHPVAIGLLRSFDGAVAAPSANRSTRISPTTADHVREELGNSVDLILDGGRCRVGIESTVLDLSGGRPVILRPGSVTRSQIQSIIGEVDEFKGSVDSAVAAISPGQHAIHYAPRSPAYRFARNDAAQFAQTMAREVAMNAVVLAIATTELWKQRVPQVSLIIMPADPSQYARDLYGALREADASTTGIILVEMPPDEPQWVAVRDRLQRATRDYP